MRLAMAQLASLQQQHMQAQMQARHQQGAQAVMTPSLAALLSLPQTQQPRLRSPQQPESRSRRPWCWAEAMQQPAAAIL